MSLDGVRRMLRDAVGRVFPAAQLVVWDGGPVLDESVGCDGATRFDVASLTKALVTTTLVMRQVDAGSLSLDDELRPGVTVRLALAHATGLPPWRPFHEGASGRQVIELARVEPLEAPPGTRSVYSDLGFILLGDAVERAGGESLDAGWARLGFGATFHPDPSRCVPTRAPAGVVDDENARAMGGVAGHAGLFATAAEVSAIVTDLVGAWRGEPGLVRPETLRRFWSPSGIPGSTWCLGWDRPSPGSSQAGTRWPRDGVGHLGFTGCSVWVDPPRARFVVLLTNRVHLGAANEAIKAFRPALHDAIADALPDD